MKKYGDRSGRNRVFVALSEVVGHPRCPIMVRHILAIGQHSIRVHRFTPGWEDAYVHNHPWWFVTFVFRGGYDDIQYEEGRVVGIERMRQGMIRFRKASHQHRTLTGPRGCTTIVFTGPLLADLGEGFGFWVKGRFLTANEYRNSPYAYAACDDRYSDRGVQNA